MDKSDVGQKRTSGAVCHQDPRCSPRVTWSWAQKMGLSIRLSVPPQGWWELGGAIAPHLNPSDLCLQNL